jgi:hypothetical protein
MQAVPTIFPTFRRPISIVLAALKIEQSSGQLPETMIDPPRKSVASRLFTPERCRDRPTTVRHLCSDYWTGNRPANVDSASAERVQLDDIQLDLRSRKGQNTWSAECQLSNHVPVGSTVLLRWTPKDCSVLDDLLPGSEVWWSGALIS